MGHRDHKRYDRAVAECSSRLLWLCRNVGSALSSGTASWAVHLFRGHPFFLLYCIELYIDIYIELWRPRGRNMDPWGWVKGERDQFRVDDWTSTIKLEPTDVIMSSANKFLFCSRISSWDGIRSGNSPNQGPSIKYVTLEGEGGPRRCDSLWQGRGSRACEVTLIKIVIIYMKHEI